MLLNSGANRPPSRQRPLGASCLASLDAAGARRVALREVSPPASGGRAGPDAVIGDGTLRQLFRGGIKRSDALNLEQVGSDVAEHSPHRQEALNEILAGGRRLC